MQNDNTHDGDYPEYWDFDRDGSELELQFRSFESAHVGGRDVAIAVGKVENVDRSVFLWPESALFGRFRDQIARRPSKRIDAGEKIRIKRGAKRPSRTNPDRQVWEWSVTFVDAPPLSQSDLFGLTDEEPDDEEEDDGTIPY